MTYIVVNFLAAFVNPLIWIVSIPVAWLTRNRTNALLTSASLTFILMIVIGYSINSILTVCGISASLVVTWLFFSLRKYQREKRSGNLGAEGQRPSIR